MASLKTVLEKIIQNRRVALLALAATFIGAWEPISRIFSYNSMEEVYYYIVHHDWTSVLSILCLIWAVWLQRREVKEIKDYISTSNKDNAEDELLHGVGWWVKSFNNSQNERDAYIAKHFPKNFNKIKDYVDAIYPLTT